MLKQLVGLILGLCLSPMAFSWWSTGHALTAEVAQQHLTPITRTHVDTLLNTTIDFPQLGDSSKQPNLSPAKLAQSLNLMATDATWADDIKRYYWKSGHEKFAYNAMHYLDIPLSLDAIDTPNYCQNTVTLQLIEQYRQGNNSVNVINAIRSALKTLVSAQTSNDDKAIALRFLIHWVGDMHQPLHMTDLQWHQQPSRGGNNIDFTKTQQPSYYQVTNSNPNRDVKLSHTNELHAYLDSGIALFHQLPETMDAPYSPNGYELWMSNLSTYISFLDQLAQQLPASKDPAKGDHLVDQWALGTTKAACQMFISEHQIHYQAEDNKKGHWLAVFNTNSADYGEKNKALVEQQLYLGGIHLAKLLNALFDQNHADADAVQYLAHIRQDDSIPLLSQLATS